MGLALLGGALQGLGHGLTQNAQANAALRFETWKERKRTETMERQAQLNDQNAAKAAARADVYDAQKGVRDHTLKLGEATIEQGFKQEIKAGDRAHDLTIEEVRAKNAQALENLNSQNTITEQGTAFARESERRAQEAGTHIDRYEVGPDGSVVGITATGNIMRSRPGLVTPPPKSEAQVTADTLREREVLSSLRDEWEEGGKKGPKPTILDAMKFLQREGAGSAAATAPAEKAPAMSARKQQALARLPTIYANATEDRYPGLFRNGRKISIQEARQLIEDGLAD
ncbi:hypothetical protein [Sphingosinicella rhizophila]|nr:hypothetical protein [Sphingosinicella sp. GR2756]